MIIITLYIINFINLLSSNHLCASLSFSPGKAALSTYANTATLSYTLYRTRKRTIPILEEPPNTTPKTISLQYTNYRALYSMSNSMFCRFPWKGTEWQDQTEMLQYCWEKFSEIWEVFKFNLDCVWMAFWWGCFWQRREGVDRGWKFHKWVSTPQINVRWTNYAQVELQYWRKFEVNATNWGIYMCQLSWLK